MGFRLSIIVFICPNHSVLVHLITPVMKSKRLNRNLYIIAATVVVFAIGYYLYLEVYTKNREEHIIATKSRILELMSQNLQVKVKSMRKNAAEYVGYHLIPDQGRGIPEKEFLSKLKQKKDIGYFNSNLEYTTSKEPDSMDKPAKDVILVESEAKSDFLYFNVLLGDNFKEYKKKSPRVQDKL